jgi:hypothetical protein
MADAPPTLDRRAIDGALRQRLWPALKAHGFGTRTSRVAWRYAGDDVDVVEVQAVGQAAEAVGCTSSSLNVYLASYPRFVPPTDRIPTRDGRLRPHYWHCDPFSQTMQKSLVQPWFVPFGKPVDRRMLPSFRLHREALSKLIDRSVRDRPDIWFMREDGSNLVENVDDMVSVVLTQGLDRLDRYHDPHVVLSLIDSGELLDPDSPHAYELREAIDAYLAGRSAS